MERSLPVISIIIPSYNQGKYIEQTIQSVLEQNYPTLEFIVIDGASTDSTIEIIRKYEDKISYWVSEPDGGQADAINKGFNKSSGDIINWLNSDDYYEKEALWKVAEAFIKNPVADVVCGKEWGFVDASPDAKVLHPGSIISPTIEETIFTGIIDQPCTFFRRSVIAPFFPLDKTLHYVMDRELWWRYLLKYGQSKIVKVNDVFTYFRLHPKSKSVLKSQLFEEEFNRLRLSLLKQLGAASILLEQIKNDNTLLKEPWDIQAVDRSKLLSEFAFFYATKAYVRNDLRSAGALMKYIKSISGIPIKMVHWKLWFKTNILPNAYLQKLKMIKRYYQ